MFIRAKSALVSRRDALTSLPWIRYTHGEVRTDRARFPLIRARLPKPLTAVYNEVGIQMLNRQLHRQIFVNPPLPRPDPRAVVISQEHLRKHGLDFTKSSYVPDVGFALPPIQGTSIDEHFHRIGITSAEPWLSLCNHLAVSSLPSQPDCWFLRPGWTRYQPNSDPCPVSFPYLSEQALVFDVETMPKYGPGPVIAVAASTDAWYVWISPWLLSDSVDEQQLIPLGPISSPRLVVGHNVSYDRARIHEEYSLPQTATRFVDTMALHIAISGMTGGQRPAWSKFQKVRKETLQAQSDESLINPASATPGKNTAVIPLWNANLRWSETLLLGGKT
jgi:DNA polymerase gamma 1